MTVGFADALILMGKAPLPGLVKTRLLPVLGRRGAAAFYRALLEDTAEELASLRALERHLFFTPPSAGNLFAGGPFTDFHRVPQSGGDLGERMSNALDLVFSRGARRAAVVGADCPALTAARVRLALGELRDGPCAVFGPAGDGGFYLAALSRPVRSIFRGVAWGTGSVLSTVTARCRIEGMPYSLLPAEADVDTPDDLAALRRWADTHAAPRCPRTRRWLRAPIDSSPRRGSSPVPLPGRRSRS